MSCSITVEFVLGTFEAASNEDLRTGEWPPHPGRLFSGLVSVAETAEELHALDWLEAQAPPIIVAAPGSAVAEGSHANYVVTNAVVRNASYQEFRARTAAGKREWVHQIPENPTVVFHWGADAGTHNAALGQLVRRVPYLGRSTSPVVCWFDDSVAAPAPDEPAWVPDASGDVDVSVPRAGYRAALDAAFAAEDRPWVAERAWVRYRSPDQAVAPASATPVAFARREWIVFGIGGRSRPPYQAVVAYTSALRAAAMKVLGDGVPYALHGHDNGDDRITERVMFHALPFVGSPHADGHLLGFAVSVPRSLPDAQRAAVYRALVGVDQIWHQGLGRLRLLRSGLRDVATLDPQRWGRPSRSWATATPVVLERFTRSDDEVAPLLLLACEHAELPQPTEVEWSRSPLIVGPDRLRGYQTVRKVGDPVRPFVHARLRFDAPVAGPLAIGHMRHFGLGLLLPEADK